MVKFLRKLTNGKVIAQDSSEKQQMSRKREQTLIFPNSSVPSVINHDLLVNLVIDQGPKGEAGKLFAEEEIKLNEIKEIRIEHLSKSIY